MSNREIFIDKLRQLSKEEMLERYIVLLNTEKLTDYVADLEAKLAEKSQKIAELGDNYARLDEKYDFLQSAHEAVVQESLGYEKEIEQLKQQIVELEEHDMIFHNQLAIEQLEKVKELLFTSAKEVTGTSIASVRLYTINEILDNQIEQLKKEMK